MNEIIKNMLERRSIRKYRPEQINPEDLNTVLKAGLYAPCAGSRQSAIIVASQNQEINQKLGEINRKTTKPRMSDATHYVSKDQPSIADDAALTDAYYGAPTLLTLFAPNNYLYGISDCSVMAENIMLAAHSLGIGSCMVMRTEDTFASEYGQNLLKDWGIDEAYIPRVNIALGYPASTSATAKPRKENRIKIIS